MDVMALRRAIMTRDGLSLPPEYQRVDYLQCTKNNSRIDTGVAGNDATLSFDFTLMSLGLSDYTGWFGNYLDENSKSWRLIQYTTSSPRLYIVTMGIRRAGSSSGIGGAGAGTGTIVGVKTHFRLGYGYCYVDCDDGYTTSGTQADDGTTAVSTRNIAIGSIQPAKDGGVVDCRFYGDFKIRRGGVLIRNYVPCSRRSDSKAGFYDTVNGTFNPSIGNTEFIAGND